MLDIGWVELFVIACIALIVIGPKDLPRALYLVGKYVGRAKSIMREFQAGIEDVARQGEFDEINKIGNPRSLDQRFRAYLDEEDETADVPRDEETEREPVPAADLTTSAAPTPEEPNRTKTPSST